MLTLFGMLWQERYPLSPNLELVVIGIVFYPLVVDTKSKWFLWRRREC